MARGRNKAGNLRLKGFCPLSRIGTRHARPVGLGGRSFPETVTGSPPR
ncbi:hypothetical protein CCC_01987 [Paramagnetospirillum magnetotacticum MS-1]|uniref:Uncharacterized protein n=1 Tax=Paramagnetospirillum magnetotacticum MS-1 TaxID=272627 RepID=A0A0C2UAM5_PARME|nr:hypothetical protein CCC_01987 [Paramagnetospirillum magnetotacticum MS-1]